MGGDKAQVYQQIKLWHVQITLGFLISEAIHK